MICDVNPFNHQHIAVIIFLDLALNFGREPSLTGRDLARLQRATKGARQSAGSRGNDIIQRCSVGLMNIRTYAVMFGNFGMHSEFDRFLRLGQIGPAQGPFYPFNSALGSVYHLIVHISSFFYRIIFESGGLQRRPD